MKLVTFAIDGCARAGLLEMQPALYPNDRHIVAVATDSRFEADLLVLSLNDEAAFALEHWPLR
jgi:hypothetical protein